MKAIKVMTKKQHDGFVKRIELHKNAIAKERDALRDILEDLEAVVESADAGLAELDSAIMSLSEYV